MPVLRTCTMETAGRTESSSPSRTPPRTSALVTWSSTTTATSTSAARRQARARTGLAADEVGDDVAEDHQDEDGDHRTEVQRAERRDEAPEDRQVRLADVAQEVQDRPRPAGVRQAPAHVEVHRREDVGDDEDRVDPDQRRDEAGDLVARRGQQQRHAPTPSTASSASWKAARTPARSSAASPRAVEPPGEVTSRRTASVSLSRAASSAAVPAKVCTTIWAALSGARPWRTPASTCASASSAT